MYVTDSHDVLASQIISSHAINMDVQMTNRIKTLILIKTDSSLLIDKSFNNRTVPLNRFSKAL